MSKLSESDIAKHAYHIWEREGRPHGRDKDHWHTAEREILGAATAQEDRPIGEIRGAQQASAQRSEKSENPPTDRQTGAAAPGRPGHPASPGITQAAAAAPKRVPQAQSEQPSRPSPQVQSGQPGATKPQQSASGRTPSPTPSSTRKSRSGGKQPDS